MVPSGWSYRRLEEFAEFKNGLNFPASARGKGLKIVGVADFGDNLRIGLDGLDELSGFEDVDSGYLLQDRDLLFVRSNGSRALVGRVLYFDRVPQRLSHSGFTIRARVKGAPLLSLFIAHFFHAGLAADQFRRLGAGTNISNVSQDVLRAIEIPVPSGKEVAAIVSIVEIWDEQVRRLHTLINAKRNLKQALMQVVLSGRSRLRGFAGDWSPLYLKDVTREVNTRNRQYLPKEAVMAVTKSEGMIPMRPELIGSSLERYKVVPPRSFAYNPMRLNIGSIAMSPATQDVLVSPDYVVFTCNDGQLDPDYLNHLRRSHQWTEYVEATGNGSVRVRIYYDDLGQMRLRLPPIEEQRCIAQALNVCNREIDLLERLHAAVKRQKRGLMQKLLTGQIRVKV